MYKILVADDELWIRKWIVKVITDMRSDVEIVGAVDNGKEALDVIESESVDILITDIHMPVLSGLELAQAVSKKNIKVIMISGYDEFEYAKKAIALRVVGYLLKPIEKDELSEVLIQAIGQVDMDHQFKVSSETIHAAIQSQLNRYVVSRQVLSLENIRGLHLDLNYQLEYFLVGRVQLDISNQTITMNRDTMDQVLRDRLTQQDCYIIAEDAMNYVVVLFSDNHLEDELIVKQKLTGVLNRLFVNNKTVFSTSYSDLLDIENALEEVNKLMEFDRLEGFSSPGLNTESMHALSSGIILALKSHNKEELTSDITFMKSKFLKMECAPEEFRIFLFGLISEVIKVIEETDGDYTSDYITKGYEFCVKISDYNDIEAMLEWFENYAGNVVDYLRSNQCYNVSEIVGKVRKYMMNHYADNINLTILCDKFGVNSSYFSKKFKEETGMNFTDMLTNIRLDVAAQLIVNTRRSLVDISNSVGFKDPKYFSKVFRKHFSMTPSQFRENSSEVGHE